MTRIDHDKLDAEAAAIIAAVPTHMTEEEYYDYEASRGDLAGTPETLGCWACWHELNPNVSFGINEQAPARVVVRLGHVTDMADPTQTYVLACGHVTI